MFGIAAELVEGLRIEIAKVRMFAQHRQFAARKRPRYSFIIFGHPIIQQFHVAHHRRIALPARAGRERPSATLPDYTLPRCAQQERPGILRPFKWLPVKDRPPNDGSSHIGGNSWLTFRYNKCPNLTLFNP